MKIRSAYDNAAPGLEPGAAWQYWVQADDGSKLFPAIGYTSAALARDFIQQQKRVESRLDADKEAYLVADLMRVLHELKAVNPQHRLVTYVEDALRYQDGQLRQEELPMFLRNQAD